MTIREAILEAYTRGRLAGDDGVDEQQFRRDTDDLLRVAEEYEWESMETAPRDGTWFLATIKSPLRSYVHKISWRQKNGPWQFCDDDLVNNDVISWMPLPEPSEDQPC